MAKKKKIRVDMKTNRSKPPRQRDWPRGFQEHGADQEATPGQERVRAKGDLSRRRTIIQEETASTSPDQIDMPAMDSSCRSGRVLRVHGLASGVQTEDGRLFRCAVRRLLKTMTSHERNVLAAGAPV